MNQFIGVLVMLNNYLHDVASALLLCCALLMLALLKRAKSIESDQVRDFFVDIYRGISIVAAVSLAWIVLGGVARTLAYRTYEWSDAAGRAQIPALIGKHIFFLILTGAGIYSWMKLRAEVVRMKSGDNRR